MALQSHRKVKAHNSEKPNEGAYEGPTPETAKKRRDDVVLTLYRRGQLGGEELRATQEIRSVWEAWGRALFPSARRLDPDAPTISQRTFRDPLQRMRDSEDAAWRMRYRPWAEEMRVSVLAPGGITRLQLVMDVVVDNRGPRELERVYHMRNGSVVPHLVDSLTRYAEISGWIRK